MKNGPDDQRNNEQEERAAWDEEKTRLQETHRKRVIFNVSSEDTEYLTVITEARPKLSNAWFLQGRVFSKRNARGNLTLCQY